MRHQESQRGRVFCAKTAVCASRSPVGLLDFASSGFCVVMPGRVKQLRRKRRSSINA